MSQETEVVAIKPKRELAFGLKRGSKGRFESSLNKKLSASITVYLTPETLAGMRQIARDENMNLSVYLEDWISKYIRVVKEEKEDDQRAKEQSEALPQQSSAETMKVKVTPTLDEKAVPTVTDTLNLK